MGFGDILGNIGNAVKKGATDVGHFAGKVASNPIVTAGAGLIGGPALGAAVGGLGHLLAPGGNLKSAAGGAAMGGVAGFAPDILSKLGLNPASALAMAKHAIGGGGEDSPDGSPDLSSVGLSGDYGLDPITMGLAGAGIANSAALGKKANDFADHAWDAANGDWQARAGMRSQGIADATTLARPRNADTSGLAAIRSQINPSTSNGPSLGAR